MLESGYTYNDKRGIFFDLFTILGSAQQSTDLNELYSLYNLEVNSRITAAYYRLCSFIKENDRDVRAFFFITKQPATLFEHLFGKDIESIKSLDDITQKIMESDAENLIIDALAYYDINNSFDREFYQNIIKDEAMFMNFLNGIEVSADHKWELLTLLRSPQYAVKCLIQFIEKVYKELELEYDTLKDLRKELEKQIRTAIDDNRMNGILKENCERLPGFCEATTVDSAISSSLFMPLRIGFIFADNRKKVIAFVGYDYFRCLEAENALMDESFSVAFKAFNDSTRARIIDVLYTKECYNGELSRMLNVPMSSLTHHLDILLSAGYVTRRLEGKRTYYKLNPVQFISASKLLRRYGE